MPTRPQGFTANSITIEGDVDKTSASGQSEALAELGAKARFARANAEGGVNGRKINYLGSADNKLDPAQDLPTVKKIVEQDKAFAIVPMVSPVLAAGGTYLVNNKVPFFGWGITPGLLQQHGRLRLHRLPGADHQDRRGLHRVRRSGREAARHSRTAPARPSR